MTRKKWIAVVLSLPVAFVLFAAARADDSKGAAYKLLTTISIPGGLGGFDISWVDSAAARYYLADRGNAAATPPVAPAIDVIDTEHDTFVKKITLSTAPNGVLTYRSNRDDDGQTHGGTLVVGGADSTAIFIDLDTLNSVAVSTKGNHRADELAYDPRDHVILIANDQDTPAPFVTFIDTATTPPTVTGTIVYDGSSGNPKSTGGIEQSVWDGAKREFYLAIPSTAANPKGEVDEIDPKSMKITGIIGTTCNPAGLVLIPGQRLMTSCGDVININAAKVINTVAKVGGDEIWFNRGDERVYFGGGLDFISVPVVQALPSFNLITTLTAGKLVVPGFSPLNDITHSVAADSENNHVFVPVSHEGVKVFTEVDE
jgi:hypothetical protein